MAKILLISNMYPSHKNPTYGIFVKQTYDWLKLKYNVTLIKITKQNNKFLKLLNYLRFYFITILLGVFFRYDCIYAHFISHMALPIRVIKKIKPNIVIIGNIHGEDVFSDFKKFEKNKQRSQIFFKYANYIISPSDYYKKRLINEYNYDETKIFVSPSGGVNIELFSEKKKLESRKQLNLDLNDFYIGFVSRLEKGKGFEYLINSFSKLNNKSIKLIIVGSGSQETKYKKMTEELGLTSRVIFIPLLEHSKLTYLYNSLDIFCFPSEAESLGLVGLEAMSCGNLCVVSDNGGISSYAVDNYNALVFQNKDEDNLLKKLQEAINIPTEKKMQLIANAKKTASAYSTNSIQKEFYNFFEGVFSNE